MTFKLKIIILTREVQLFLQLPSNYNYHNNYYYQMSFDIDKI